MVSCNYASMVRGILFSRLILYLTSFHLAMNMGLMVVRFYLKFLVHCAHLCTLPSFTSSKEIDTELLHGVLDIRFLKVFYL
jgi:hypothetical protein